MKATEQYFHLLLFILYKVVLTFKSVDKTLVCDHANERVLSFVTVYTIQGVPNFYMCQGNPLPMTTKQ